MNSLRTDYIATTSIGTVIEAFETRELALAWAEARGDLFPGWSIKSRTTRTVVVERELRRDRSAEGRAA